MVRLKTQIKQTSKKFEINFKKDVDNENWGDNIKDVANESDWEI